MPTFGGNPWWVSPGQPMLFVEYHAGEVADPPNTGRQVYLPPDYGLRLDHWWTSFGNREAQAWLLGRTAASDKDALRRVRVHLMRLHAELECAKQVLRLTQDEDGSSKVAPAPDSAEAAALRAYVERLQRLLRRENVYGHPQEPILEAALAAGTTVAPDDWVGVREVSWQVLDDLMREAEEVNTKFRYPV
jgi:hypothetical protein